MSFRFVLVIDFYRSVNGLGTSMGDEFANDELRDRTKDSLIGEVSKGKHNESI